jgi:N-acyl-D-amino-acid deacylase
VLAQGITTVLVNPDGGGPVDLVAQRAGYEKGGIGVNVGLMVPHGSVRAAVLGMSARDPSPADQARMNTLVREGMRAGAFGLSSGLYYAPGSYSNGGSHRDGGSGAVPRQLAAVTSATRPTTAWASWRRWTK